MTNSKLSYRLSRIIYFSLDPTKKKKRIKNELGNLEFQHIEFQYWLFITI